MNPPGEEYLKVQEAAGWIKDRMPFIPKVGIILGTGHGRWLDELNITFGINIPDVPNMIPPSVASHKGKLYFTTIQHVPVAILAGRVHYYEGYEMNEVVRPVRILHAIGCTHIIFTNAAGGLNPAFEAGDIVAIRDHINLMNAHPLRGPNEERWGPRFPDMMNAYDRDWLSFTQRRGESLGIKIKSGVYAGLTGPSLETPAEYDYLHRIGADLVGMSAVPEVIAAAHLGMKVLALSVVSNVCYPPERIKVTTVEDVINIVETKAVVVGSIIRDAVSYAEKKG